MASAFPPGFAPAVRAGTSDPAWQDATRIHDDLKRRVSGSYAALYVGATPYLSYLMAQDPQCEGVVVVAPAQGALAALDQLEVGDFFEPYEGAPADALRRLRTAVQARTVQVAVVWDLVVSGLQPQAAEIQLFMESAFFAMRRYANNPVPERDAPLWALTEGQDRTLYYTFQGRGAAPAPTPAAAPRMDTGGAVLPVPITPEERRQMETNLLAFIQSFLPQFVKNPPVSAYLAPEFQPLWIRAFTHETVDPENNYELFEYKGDRTLDYAVNEYIMRRFPNATKGQYSNMKSALVSKSGLQAVNREFGFSSYAITFKSTRHLNEDLVESFLGALVEVSDRLVFGLGYLNVYNFVVWYFNQRNLSMEVQGKNPYRTLVQQVFSRLFTQERVSSMLQEEITHPGEDTLVALVLSPQARSRLAQKFNKRFPEGPLGTGQALDKKVATTMAYESAYSALRAQGVTEDWAEAESLRMDFEAVGPEYERALAKARAAGYTDIVLFKSVNMTDRAGTMAILVGVRPDGKRETIAVGEGTTRTEAIRAAVVAYASS
jgi:dsRNA-specific ribonuclease